MRLSFLLNASALVLSVAGQTSYNNGLWTPAATAQNAQQSWTTWTSLYVVGTVTVIITSTVLCSTSYTTTTSITTTTVCSVCPVPPPVCQATTTTICAPVTTCLSTSQCLSTLSWSGYTFVPVETCIPLTTCIPATTWNGYTYGPATTCSSTIVSTCNGNNAQVTSGYTQQLQPYTTITSGTVVYVVMPGTAGGGAPAGQVTTNGVIQVISGSAAESTRGHDKGLVASGGTLAVVLLSLVLM